MSGSVFLRLLTYIDGESIRHVDWAADFAAAERIAGERLDRRCQYMIMHGELHSLTRWTQHCSGCGEGGGCSECGYTGKRRMAMYLPWISPRLLGDEL